MPASSPWWPRSPSCSESRHPPRSPPSPTPSTRSVVASIAHDVDIPAGDHVDLLVIVRGHADIAGSVDTIVVVDGSATLTGATARLARRRQRHAPTSMPAPGSRATSGRSTGTVTQATGAVVGGSVRTFERNAAALALLLIPLFLLLMIGLAVTGIVVALLVAAFAARQVRTAESLISRRARHGPRRGHRRVRRAADPGHPDDDHASSAPRSASARCSSSCRRWRSSAGSSRRSSSATGSSSGARLPRVEPPYAPPLIGVIVLAIAGIIPSSARSRPCSGSAPCW